MTTMETIGVYGDERAAVTKLDKGEVAATHDKNAATRNTPNITNVVIDEGENYGEKGINIGKFYEIESKKYVYNKDLNTWFSAGDGVSVALDVKKYTNKLFDDKAKESFLAELATAAALAEGGRKRRRKRKSKRKTKRKTKRKSKRKSKRKTKRKTKRKRRRRKR